EMGSDGFDQDEISQFQCSAHRVSESPICGEFMSGVTSPYFPSGFGDAFIGSSDGRTLVRVVPGPSTTDTSELGDLTTLGGSSAGPFTIPPGDPLSAFPAVEPASVVLLGLGFAGLVARRAAQGRFAKDLAPAKRA